MNINNKTYLTLLIIVLTLFTIVNFSSCDDGPNNPTKNADMIIRWEVDTISYPGSQQTSMSTIWGNSIDDLFIAGHNNRGLGKAFHYDGKSWRDFLPILPNKFDTFTFSNSINFNDEVFLCGTAHYITNDLNIRISDSSLILSSKNNNWNISQLGGGGSIYSISGTREGKLYAAGWALTLFEYNDNSWSQISIDLDIPKFYQTKSITGILVDHNQAAYMSVFCYSGNPYAEKQYFLKENNGFWKVTDSLSITDTYTIFGYEFIESLDGTIYSFNPGIYVYSDFNWNSIWNEGNIITAMETTKDNNIIAAGRGIYFFDGHEWIADSSVYNKYGLAKDILVLENNVVVLFSDSRNSYVLRGYK